MDETSRPLINGQSPNVRKTDILLKLKVIDGKKPLSSTGMVDPRLFTAENNLHVILDPQTCLWHFAYDSGILPNALKQRFTTYSKALIFVTDYLKLRNIEIVEIVD